MTPNFTYDLPLPHGRDIGIGIIGAGTIVTNSHLPAYSEAGFRVVAIADRDTARAAALARRFDIPHAFGSADELLAHPEVAVVDIAVPPLHQPALARATIAAGKHALCHKPLAPTLDDAVSLVDAARHRGVKLAVNQNARWIPGIRATAGLLRDGTLGDPTGAHFDLGWRNEYESMDPDWRAMGDLTLRTDVVHHVDTCRLWFGEPDWVFATHWERGEGETAVQAVLHYAPGFVATIRAAGGEAILPGWARYRVEGSRGRAEGELAQYTSYGLPIDDPYELRIIDDPTVVYRPRFPFTTVPHAFMATMGLLLRAVERGEEPAESSGMDNLHTLRVIEALALSAGEMRVVRPKEIPIAGGHPCR